MPNTAVKLLDAISSYRETYGKEPPVIFADSEALDLVIKEAPELIEYKGLLCFFSGVPVILDNLSG